MKKAVIIRIKNLRTMHFPKFFNVNQCKKVFKEKDLDDQVKYLYAELKVKDFTYGELISFRMFIDRYDFQAKKRYIYDIDKLILKKHDQVQKAKSMLITEVSQWKDKNTSMEEKSLETHLLRPRPFCRKCTLLKKETLISLGFSNLIQLGVVGSLRDRNGPYLANLVAEIILILSMLAVFLIRTTQYRFHAIHKAS